MSAHADSFTVDFIGIGAPRCGTTWIFRCLQDHPGVATPYIKEVDFFTNEPEVAKGLPAYRRFFDACPPGAVVGEFSPIYLRDPQVPARIHALLPDVKLIASLRNPADALYSLYQFRLARGRHRYASFEAFLDQEPGEVANWQYMPQLDRYLACFPREQLLVVIFEDIATDPRAFMERIYRYIGVAPDFASELVEKRINAGRDYKVYALSRFLYGIMRAMERTAAGRRTVAWLKHSRLKAGSDAVFERNKDDAGADDDRPAMLPETRARLAECFREDRERLEVFLGRSLNAWQ